MQTNKEHTIFKVIGLILALALLVPSVIKFSHAFTHHQHEICNGEYQTHLHKSDIDCDFYKFKLSSQFYFLIEDFLILEKKSESNRIFEFYSFLNNHQQLPFSLRGPPVLV